MSSEHVRAGTDVSEGHCQVVTMDITFPSVCWLFILVTPLMDGIVWATALILGTATMPPCVSELYYVCVV